MDSSFCGDVDNFNDFPFPVHFFGNGLSEPYALIHYYLLLFLQETYAQLLQGKAQQELSDSRAAHASLVQPQQNNTASTTTATAAATTGVNTNINNDATVGKKRPAVASGGGGSGAAESPQVAPALRDAPLQVEQLR